MTPDNVEGCILIRPTLDPRTLGDFLHGVADAAKHYETMRSDKAFAGRMERLEPFGFNLEADGLLLVQQSLSTSAPFTILTGSHLAQGFSIFADCGFFKRVAYFYEFATSGVIAPPTLKAAIERLLDTEDDASMLHPENLVSSIPPHAVARELADLERSPDQAVTRLPSKGSATHRPSTKQSTRLSAAKQPSPPDTNERDDDWMPWDEPPAR